MFTRSSYYQIALIVLGVLATALVGVFFYRELYPEYRLYQSAFIDLENFRSSYTGVPPAPFKEAVKQIVILSPDKGEPIIDRCVSCHVTLDIDHYSPTKIATDVNGRTVFDQEGNPVKVPNPDYIWKRLGDRIAELRSSKVKDQLEEADRLAALQTVQVGEQVYDMSKVLMMHPLIGRETRPFQYHSLEEYGCVTCHSGNGRGLVTDKAHGPVFDGTYEVAFELEAPHFTESDPENDPRFAHVLNHQPGHDLIFQTTPILVGSLMQAKCVQCHQPISQDISSSLYNVELAIGRKESQLRVVQDAWDSDVKALVALLALKQKLNRDGYTATVDWLRKSVEDYTQSSEVLQQRIGQFQYVSEAVSNQAPTLSPDQLQKQLSQVIDRDITRLVGSKEFEKQFDTIVVGAEGNAEDAVKRFVLENKGSSSSGTLFVKAEELRKSKEELQRARDAGGSLQALTGDREVLQTLETDIDRLTQSYRRGEQLYVSQACYACHRIAGMFRGGTGPDLTRIGLSYPWFIKESIVWPQADLPTSTMPNFHLDHVELEELMTFMLAQRGAPRSISHIEYQTHVKMWEAGEKVAIEKPLPVEKLYDLQAAQIVFGTEGCAACHRLEGFESNVGFRVEKGAEQPNQETLSAQHAWFRGLVPEDIRGSDLVEVLEKYATVIDERIVDNVRSGSILEALNQEIPDDIISYYANFRYATRARDAYYRVKAQAEQDPVKRAEILQEAEKWKERVHRVLMVYVQEYGLGRLVGPRLNWSGIFRTDQWLMEHFWKPTSHSPNSIMPVMPFDNTKFYALTHLLDTFAQKNNQELRERWQRDGFSPEIAFQIYCAQCHGESLRGNGPVAEWIYPVPKNLRNADFVRNLTKEQAIFSITHGVKGTPMPPWGEVAGDKGMPGGVPVLTQGQIKQLVDWIFSGVAGGSVIQEPADVPKWRYGPQDVIDEMRREGGTIGSRQSGQVQAKAVSRVPPVEIAAVDVPAQQPPKEGSVEQLFDVIPNPLGGPDPELYYIKRRYYTQENLDAGRQLFVTNCSVCHGKEAGGDGVRAESMTESKPRMFTNPDWLHTPRDDLRLLRSIKYGVPGTSMTPWGDYTSALQRIQMVMYIRSLTQESDSRMRLDTALYQVFEVGIKGIEEQRAQLAAAMSELRQQERVLQDKKSQLYQSIEQGKGSAQDVRTLYQEETAIAAKLQQATEQDTEYQAYIKKLKKNGEAYRVLGENILSSKIDDGLLQEFLKVIMLNKDLYVMQDGHLQPNADRVKHMEEIGQQMIASIDDRARLLQKQVSFERAKIPSAETQEQILRLEAEQAQIAKFRNRLTSFLGGLTNGSSR